MSNLFMLDSQLFAPGTQLEWKELSGAFDLQLPVDFLVCPKPFSLPDVSGIF